MNNSNTIITNNIQIQLANQNDITFIKSICHDNKETLGFVTLGRINEAINKREILIVPNIAFINFHTRKDNISVCYLLCVIESKRFKGIGTELLKAWYLTVKDYAIKLRLKCSMNNDAIIFYQKKGFTQIDIEHKNNKQIAILEMDIHPHY